MGAHDLVTIKGPTKPGGRVLRPPALYTRAKAHRFYNAAGEAFEAECPMSWARQLEAAGDAVIVAPKVAPAKNEKAAPKAEKAEK